MDLLERSLILHCSPTLASLKMASMFAYSYSSEENLSRTIFLWNREVNKRGVYLKVLKRSEKRALIYVYRLSDLEKVLRQPEIMEFLFRYGYQYQNSLEAIEKLSIHLKWQEEFPHEIGIFLGYPLADVVGFIENEGKNFLCAGNWKVYADKEESQKRFERYQKCTKAYVQLWKKGKSIRRLTVAA